MRLREWIPPVDAAAALERIEANGRYDFNGIIAGLMETWCAAQGKDRWGEKTPAHIFFADRILCGFPKAQFVHIVRDGRDVAVSWKNVPFGPKHVYASARRWADVLDAGHKLQETVSDKQYLELRYEDLLHDTEATIRRICHFLGEEYSPQMLRFHESQGKYPTDPVNEVNLAKPVMVGNVGKWRRNLSSREVRIFEAVAGDKLEAYGYVRTRVNPRLSALERLSCKYIEHPSRKIVPIATNRRSHVQALSRGLMYMRLRAGF